MHAYMHAYMYISISIIPSFLFSWPLCHVIFLVLFYQLYFLFYLCTTLYIHIAQNSKGIKGDAMKSLISTLSSATNFFSLKATSVTKFVYLFLKYYLPSFYTIALILYYYLNLAFSLNLENYPTSHIYACKAPLLSLNLLSMAFYFVYVPLLI